LGHLVKGINKQSTYTHTHTHAHTKYGTESKLIEMKILINLHRAQKIL